MYLWVTSCDICLHFRVVGVACRKCTQVWKRSTCTIKLSKWSSLVFLLRFLLPLLFKNFKLPLKMALLSPYAQFRIFSICIVVWKVLEYKHTSLRRRSSFEELKCLLLYNRWSMSKSLNYSWHAEAFKQLAKALLCSSHPIFFCWL